MKYPFIIFFFLLQLSLKSQTYDVLFLGNSYTFYNNMPSLVSSIANSFEDTLNFSSNTPGGWQLANHAEQNSSSLQAINQQSWDYVVIQAQSQEPSFPPFQVEEQTYPAAESLVQSILENDSCTEPMFFMTWGRKNGDAVNGVGYPTISTYQGMQSRLRNSYLEMGYDNNSSVAPVGMAWKRSIDENPDFELYTADESHPNLAGSYLAACVFYSSMFKKSCVGSSYIPDGLDSIDAFNLQTIASEVVLDSTQVWNLFDVQSVEISNNGDEFDFNVFATNYDSITWDFGDGTSSNQIFVSHAFETNKEFEVTLSVYSKNGCDVIQSSHFIDTYNVSNIKELKKVSNIYPNPFSSHIYLDLNSLSTIELYSLKGDLVFKQQTSENVFDLRNLKAGAYFLRITSNSETETFKIFKSE
ncbi:MAG: T9SS type A sorting domain-containing protein [Flavobacteriales bacterium]